MNRKISKRTREQAILIAAIAASGGVYVSRQRGRMVTYAQIADATAASWCAYDMACMCFSDTWRVGAHPLVEPDSHPGVYDAEVECRLREGWTPE